jgi:hypothetical protein
MIRTAFAIAVAVVTVASVAGISHAAPVAPLPAGVQTESSNLTPVRLYCYRHYTYTSRRRFLHWGRC